MDTINRLNYIYQELKNGNIRIIDMNNKVFLNEEAMRLLNLSSLSSNDLESLDLIIRISNAIYHNVDNDTLVPIDDGIYDLLMVLISKYMNNYQVGSDDIIFTDTYQDITENKQEVKLVCPVKRIPLEEAEFYHKDILHNREFIPQDFYISPVIRKRNIERRVINTPHKYPELVGTLDKCKFVLNNQAKELGVFDDANVRIFERDFIQKHIQQGIISPIEKFFMVAELKYDGVSIEAEVSDHVISARSRGDTNNDVATDLTPILEGYRFPAAEGMKDVVGMKFEAILTNYNLQRLGQMQGKAYKNARNAMAGILGSNTGNLYRDFITLVPLEVELPEYDLDRVGRIEFLNTYYTTGVDLKYAILYGDYREILFKVKRFVEEAEALRPYMPFLYDGVVISYIDKDKIAKLGRENSVNKYSIAIKFNPMKHQTTFLGYTYTIGQSGVVTPMIHYNPVEFYGGIHTKSSGHSYKRFRELGLRKGDIIEVTYTNDVMPYVTKPDIAPNRENTNSIEEFPKVCPCCGTELIFTDKSAICPNIECKERNNARMENMLDKLQLKDFAGERLQSIGKYSLTELMDLTVDDVRFLGEINSQKFVERMNELKIKPIYDYQIVGALGFTGIAQEKWKLILTNFSLLGLMTNYNKPGFVETLTSVKGIGPATAETIRNEMWFFIKDLTRIVEMENIITSYGNNVETKVIRFTGFRDKALVERLKSMGFDAGEGSVTKKTDILLIPCEGFTSTKTAKAEKDNIMIVPVEDFIANMDKYLA